MSVPEHTLGLSSLSTFMGTVRVTQAVEKSAKLYTPVDDTPTTSGVGDLSEARYIVIWLRSRWFSRTGRQLHSAETQKLCQRR